MRRGFESVAKNSRSFDCGGKAASAQDDDEEVQTTSRIILKYSLDN